MVKSVQLAWGGSVCGPNGPTSATSVDVVVAVGLLQNAEEVLSRKQLKGGNPQICGTCRFPNPPNCPVCQQCGHSLVAP